MLFDLVRAAREVIASDTQHPSSNLELVHYLKDLLSCIDFELVEQTASVGDRVQANIIGLRGPTTVGDGLILSSPLDTVPYVDRDTWRTCAGEPLEPVLSAGAIFGLGARSGKIDFLCKLKAAAQFQGRPLSRPLYLAGTFGRYHDFLGVRTLLETHLFRAKRVLVGWPTNLELVTTVKSHVVFRFCFTCEAGERSPGGTPLELITRAPCAPSEWPGLGDDVVRRALRAFTTARKGNPGLCLTGVAATAPAGLTPHSCRLAVVGAASAELGSEWSPCAAGEELVDLSAVVPAVTLVIEALDQLLADLEPLSDHSFRPPRDGHRTERELERERVDADRPLSLSPRPGRLDVDRATRAGGRARLERGRGALDHDPRRAGDSSHVARGHVDLRLGRARRHAQGRAGGSRVGVEPGFGGGTLRVSRLRGAHLRTRLADVDRRLRRGVRHAGAAGESDGLLRGDDSTTLL